MGFTINGNKIKMKLDFYINWGYGMHIERTGDDEISLHGAGRQSLRISISGGSRCAEFSNSTFQKYKYC